MNKVLEDIQIEKDYYDGLKKALIPNRMIIADMIKEELFDEVESYLFQRLIYDNPQDDRLIRAINNDEDGLFLCCFLFIPLRQVIDYIISNCLSIYSNLRLPPKYAIYDAESICEELRKLKMRGRENIYNYYCEIDFRYSEKLNQAIMEPNVEIMRELLDSKTVDLLWLQRLLGARKYFADLNDAIVDNVIVEDDGKDFLRFFMKAIEEDDIPYYSDFIRIILNSDDDYSLFEILELILKYYWYICHLFREKTRTIIDAYIGKPCFEEFVSKCRSEFDEEEKERRNCDFSWLPENFFNDSNPPDTKKKNHLTDIMDAVTHGWFFENGPQSEEEKNGDGREKIMTLINECARLNFIKDDNETKARMAYVLTGRNVGFNIDEEKPLVWNSEYRNYLFYLLKFLFKRAPFKKAFSIIDGIGEYVYFDAETGKLKIDNFSGLAERRELKTFSAFVHGLYYFCNSSRTKKGEGKQITKRPKKSKKQESSEEAES